MLRHAITPGIEADLTRFSGRWGTVALMRRVVEAGLDMDVRDATVPDEGLRAEVFAALAARTRGADC
jgi:hypothetical protein